MTDAQFRKFLQEQYRHFNALAKACQEALKALDATTPPKIVYNSEDGDGVVSTPPPQFEER